MYVNDGQITIAGLAAQYDLILTENLKFRQDRTDLKRENSAQAAEINSLRTQVAKLKEQIKESNIE